MFIAARIFIVMLQLELEACVFGEYVDWCMDVDPDGV